MHEIRAGPPGHQLHAGDDVVTEHRFGTRGQLGGVEHHHDQTCGQPPCRCATLGLVREVEHGDQIGVGGDHRTQQLHLVEGRPDGAHRVGFGHGQHVADLLRSEHHPVRGQHDVEAVPGDGSLGRGHSVNPSTTPLSPSSTPPATPSATLPIPSTMSPA